MSSPVFEVRVVGSSLRVEEDEEDPMDGLDVVVSHGSGNALSFTLERDDVKTLARALRDWLS